MLPSASSIWLAFACALSAVLRGARAPTAAMAHGTEVHAVLEGAARLTEPSALPSDVGLDEDARSAVLHWWAWRWSPEVTAWWPPGDARAHLEAGVAIDLVTLTARRIPSRCPETGYERAGLAAHEVPCTLDLAIAPGADGVAEVVDWKTSRALDLHPLAREAWACQVETYAIAWSLLHDGCDVRVRTVQVGPDGVEERPARLLSGYDLLGRAGELAELLRRVTADDVEPRPGGHCTQCPGASRCPAAAQAAADAVELVEPQVAATSPAAPVRFALARPTSPEHAQWLLDRIGLAKAFLTGVEAELRAWVREQPGSMVALPDGRVAGFVQKRGARKVDPNVPGAYAVIARAVGADRAEQAAPREATITSLEAAVRGRVQSSGGRPPKGAIKEASEALLAELLAIGAITTGAPHSEWRVERPKGTPEALLEATLRASVDRGAA